MHRILCATCKDEAINGLQDQDVRRRSKSRWSLRRDTTQFPCIIQVLYTAPYIELGRPAYWGSRAIPGWSEPSVRPRLPTSESNPPKLPAHYLVGLHLAPGIVFSAFLFVLAGIFAQHGLTAYLAELISIPACLMPLLIGIIFLSNCRSSNARPIIRAITYRERGTVGDYMLWPILLYICWALNSLLVIPLTTGLETRFFGWFPTRLTTHSMISDVAASPPAQRHATFVLAILLSGVLAPLVEEAYFRGFLLPRMSHLGWMAPVINAFLFGLYHFFSPWSLPIIFVAFVPVAFIVQARKNFRIGFVVHAMFNLTGVFTLFLHPT